MWGALIGGAASALGKGGGGGGGGGLPGMAATSSASSRTGNITFGSYGPLPDADDRYNLGGAVSPNGLILAAVGLLAVYIVVKK